ncbi:MAG: cadherin repeat domain-containing protein [Solirubrobacteraceae bacterium]
MATPGLLAVTPPLTILTRRLPSARAGHHYRARIWSSLGTPPSRWRIISGRLPGRFTLDPHPGTITGTPVYRTTAHFRVRVTDAGHPAATATRSFTLTVAAARRHRHRR